MIISFITINLIVKVKFEMQFIVYYEFDPNLDPEDMFKAYQKIQEAEIDLDSETKSWYMTPEHWGVAIVETVTRVDSQP